MWYDVGAMCLVCGWTPVCFAWNALFVADRFLVCGSFRSEVIGSFELVDFFLPHLVLHRACVLAPRGWAAG